MFVRHSGPSALVLCLAVLACADETNDRPVARDGGGAEATAFAAARVAIDSLAALHQAEVSVYYRSLAANGDSLLVRPDVRMHAASTMKVPVLLQLHLDRDQALRSLDDSLVVRTDFTSIVDGSPYELDAGSDSDSTLYDLVGQSLTVRELASRMITRSSNLATNLLIAEVGAERVTATLRALGADSIEVRRGVEDLPAFEAGLNNTTTARDLGRLFVLLGGPGDRAGSRAGALGLSDSAREEMLDVLQRQEFRDKIPAGLPAGVRVANKTGWITGISHDAAVVFPPADPPYVLVVLTRGVDDGDQAETLIADVSRRIWTLHTGGPRVAGGE